MTYEATAGGYVFWNDVLLLPCKKKSPGEKTKYFRKEIPFEEAATYWEYACEDGMWNIYYVKRGSNRRLAQANIGKFRPESILTRLADKDITVNDCRQVEEHQVSMAKQKVMTGVFWSIEYDGKSVFDLMEEKQKMPFAHIKMVITNEGGYIDDEGIIHKGTCQGN